MIAIVCLSSADATSFASAIDAKMIYPQDGIDMGDGIHASKAESRTTRYGPIIKHPTLNLWAYPQDANVQTQVAKSVSLPPGATIQTLDATWNLTTAVPVQATADVIDLP